MITRDINRVVKVITFSFILVFKFRDKRITSKKMQIFFSCCHFLRLIRQYVIITNAFVEEVPSQVIQKVLETHKVFSRKLDLGNILIFSSDFVPQIEKEFSWMLVQTLAGNARWVCSVSIPLKKMDNRCLCSYQFYHNLFGGKTESNAIQIFPETVQKSNNINLTNASMVRVALLNSMQNGDSFKKLKTFFSSPKYVQQGDLVKIDEEMMLSVVSVDGPKSIKRNIGYFVENQKSSLFQVSSIPSLKIPIKRKMKLNWRKWNRLSTYEEIHSMTIASQPPAFAEYCDFLRKLMEPFLSNSSDILEPSISVTLPTFLMTGPSGSGKRFVVKCVADTLGLHFMEASCLGLLGESSKASELRIHNLFENARQVSPVILYLTDIEVSFYFGLVATVHVLNHFLLV